MVGRESPRMGFRFKSKSLKIYSDRTMHTSASRRRKARENNGTV